MDRPTDRKKDNEVYIAEIAAKNKLSRMLKFSIFYLESDACKFDCMRFLGEP